MRHINFFVLLERIKNNPEVFHKHIIHKYKSTEILGDIVQTTTDNFKPIKFMGIHGEVNDIYKFSEELYRTSFYGEPIYVKFYNENTEEYYYYVVVPYNNGKYNAIIIDVDTDDYLTEDNYLCYSFLAMISEYGL